MTNSNPKGRRRRCPRSVPPLLLIAPWSLLACGCGEHAEPDHAAHMDPDHRPEDFPSALKTLIEWNRRMVEASPGESPSTAGELSPAEWIDIARWMPELAADSDMPEGPWNEARALALRLESTYELLKERQEFDASMRDALRRDLEQMRAFQARLDSAWFPTSRSEPEWEEAPFDHPDETIGPVADNAAMSETATGRDTRSEEPDR